MIFPDKAGTWGPFLTFLVLVSDFKGTGPRLCSPELTPWNNSILLQQLLRKARPVETTVNKEAISEWTQSPPERQTSLLSFIWKCFVWSCGVPPACWCAHRAQPALTPYLQGPRERAFRGLACVSIRQICTSHLHPEIHLGPPFPPRLQPRDFTAQMRKPSWTQGHS